MSAPSLFDSNEYKVHLAQDPVFSSVRGQMATEKYENRENT